MDENMDEIAKNLSKMKQNIIPELEKLLDGYEAKATTIFFSAIIKALLNEIDERDFKELIIKYIIEDIHDDKI